MAKDGDDVFNDGPPKRYAGAVNKAADAFDNLKDAKEKAADVDSPDLGAIKNFEDMAKAQETLGEQFKRSTKEIWDQAKQIGSLSSQLSDATGAVKGFGQHLQKTASITHQYSLAMKEFKQGTEAYTQSLSLSTAKLGKASEETTKFMKATQHAYNKAYDVAKLYGIEVDQVRQQMNKLQVTFASQLAVTDNHGKALVRLTKDAMMFARTAGIDTSEAVKRLDERLQASNMTLEEVRVEQMLVMKEMDNYKKGLQALGKEAQKTGNVTSKDLVKALQQVRQEFKMGAYDAGAFAKSFTAMTLKGKKLGLTPEQLKGNVTALGTIMKKLASPDTFTGMTSALEMVDKAEQFKGTTAGTRMMDIQRRFKGWEIDKIRAAKLASEATAGSSQAMAIQARIISKAMPENLMGHRVEQLGVSATSADMFAQMASSGELEKIFQQAGKRSPAEKAKEAAAFATPMEKLVKEAHTAQSTRHKTAKTLFDFKQTVTKFMEKYWYMMAAIQMGGSFLGRGGGAAQGALSGAARGSTRVGAGRIASRLSTRGRFMSSGAGQAAKGVGAAIALAATFKGLETAWKVYKKGDKAEAAAAVVASPFIGGYQMGQGIDKSVGGAIASTYSLQEQAALGKDKNLSNLIATGLYNAKTGGTPEGWKMIQENRIGMDWEAFNQQKDIYKIKEKEIGSLEKKKKRDGYLSQAEEKLLDQKRDELRLMEKRIAGLKRSIDAEKRTPDRFKREAQQDINDALLALGGGKVKSKGDVRQRMDNILKQSSRMRKGGRSAMEGLAGKSIQGAMLRKFMQQAEAQGVSKEEFGEMWAERAASIEKEMGATRMDAGTKYAPTAEAVDNLKQQNKVKVEVSLTGNNEGSSGEKTVATKPDGSVVETTKLGIGVDATVRVSGETNKQKVLHDAKQMLGMRGNKQAR